VKTDINYLFATVNPTFLPRLGFARYVMLGPHPLKFCDEGQILP